MRFGFGVFLSFFATLGPGLTATLYLANAGDDDRGDACKTLATALRAAAPKGLTWYYEPRPDLKHSTIYRAASPECSASFSRP